VKDRKYFEISGFLGIDFTTSPLKVNQRRAVSGVNFISDYGTLKKRPGWIEQIRFIDKPIKGMYHYKSLTDDFMIVRAGDKLYRVNNDLTYETLYTIAAKTDERITFYPMNDKVYIVGLGKYLVFYQDGIDDNNNAIYVIDEVRNHATVPTTTISIDDSLSEIISRASLDPVNLLTKTRKNTLIGRNVANLKWELDSGVREIDSVLTEVLVDIEHWDGTSLAYKKYKTYPNQAGVEDYLFDISETEFIVGNAKGIIERVKKGTEAVYYWEQTTRSDYLNAKTQLYHDISGIATAVDVALVNGLYPPTENLYASNSGSVAVRIEYTPLIGVENLSSYWRLRVIKATPDSGVYQNITIYETTEPPLEGADNITVTFESSDVIDDKNIQNASIGIVFGVNGTTNQLFLANGAIEQYSMPYDFSYFPDIYINYVGDKTNPIVGYSRLSDTALVIYKDSKSYESRLYFRTMTLSVDETNVETRYRLFDKAIDVNIGCDAKQSIANLSGDNLFLAVEGVYAVTLGENVSVESRHVRERSQFINKHLEGENISKAISIVFDNRLYMAVEDQVYVADARFRSAGNMDDTFNYEWFYWDNISVSSWLVKDNELYFGTDEGRICKFDDLFSDRTLIKAEQGDVTLTLQDNYLVYNEAIPVKEDDEIYADCYMLLIPKSAMTVETGVITVSYPIDSILEDGLEIYIRDEASGLNEGTKYTVVNVAYDQFSLVNVLGQAITPTQGFDVLLHLLNKKMFTTNVDEVNSKFQLKSYVEGEPVSLVNYTLDPITFTIVIHEPVRMVWYSPIFDLGSSMYAKTLFAMTVSADASTTGEIKFGFDTRNISRNIQSLNFKSFTFDDIDFNNFTFLTAIASSFTKRIKEKDFNFIIFKIGSETPTSAVINNLSILYKINQMNKGMR